MNNTPGVYSIQNRNMAQYGYGKRPKPQPLDFHGLFIKYLLMALTIFSVCIGLSLMGVTIWLIVERSFVAALFGNNLYAVSLIMLLIASITTIVISIIGFYGAWRLNKQALLAFIITLSIVVAMLLIIGILAIIFRTKIGDRVRDRMTRDIQNRYGQPREKDITEAWDRSQERLHCCGVLPYGWSVWKGSLWWEDQPGDAEHTRVLVPPSCCIKDQYGEYLSLELCQKFRMGPPTIQNDEPNAVYDLGCYEQGRNWLWDHSAPIIGVGFGISVLIIGDIVLAILLYSTINKMRRQPLNAH